MLRITLYSHIFITYVLFDTKFECFDVYTKYYFGIRVLNLVRYFL